jgi:hypothetical protein
MSPLQGQGSFLPIPFPHLLLRRTRSPGFIDELQAAATKVSDVPINQYLEDFRRV